MGMGPITCAAPDGRGLRGLPSPHQVHHRALHSRRAIVSGPLNFITCRAEFRVEDDLRGRTCSAQSRDAIAGLAESARHGQQLRHAHASGDAHHVPNVFNRRGLPQRSEQVGQNLAGLHRHQDAAGLADSLHHQRDAAFFGVAVHQGQGDALAVGAGTQNHELPRLPVPGDAGGLHFKPGNFRSNQPLRQNAIFSIAVGVVRRCTDAGLEPPLHRPATARLADPAKLHESPRRRRGHRAWPKSRWSRHAPRRRRQTPAPCSSAPRYPP